MHSIIHSQDRIGVRRSARPSLRRAFASTVFALATAVPAQAATWTVTNKLDAGAGSLRAAIASAANFDTIDFAPSVTGTITLTSGPLVINGKKLFITGPGAGVLKISGGGTLRVFQITGAAVAWISQLTIADGYLAFNGATAQAGAAIAISGADANLDRVVVRDSRVDCGSAVQQTTYEAAGGGISVEGAGSLNATNSTIEANSIVNCSRAFGGGVGSTIRTTRGTPKIKLVSSTVSGNRIESGRASAVGYGGGVSAAQIAFLSNSTISGNSINLTGASAVGQGGGFDTSRSPSGGTFTNNTVAYNTAASSLPVDSSVGGFYDGPVAATSPMNNIVAYNGVDWVRTTGTPVTSIPYNLIGGTPPPGGVNGLFLGPLGFNGGATKTHALLAGVDPLGYPTGTYAGVGTGNPSACVTIPMTGTDQRGMVRPAACSIGAYEPLFPVRLVKTAGDNQSATVNTAFAEALAVALVDGANLPILVNRYGGWTNLGSGPGLASEPFSPLATTSSMSSGPVSANGVSGAFQALATMSTRRITGDVFSGELVWRAYFQLANLPSGTVPACGFIAPPDPMALPAGTVGTTFPALAFSAAGGTNPNDFTVISGSLPDGLALEGGVLGGVPRRAGTFTFTVRALGQGWDPGCGNTRAYTVDIAPGTQTLTFLTTPGQPSAGQSYEPFARSSAGLVPILLSVDPAAEGTCSIDGFGLVTFLSAGTCVIRADQPGDGDHAPAQQIVQSFAVAAAPAVPVPALSPGLLGFMAVLTGVGGALAQRARSRRGD